MGRGNSQAASREEGDHGQAMRRAAIPDESGLQQRNDGEGVAISVIAQRRRDSGRGKLRTGGCLAQQQLQLHVQTIVSHFIHLCQYYHLTATSVATLAGLRPARRSQWLALGGAPLPSAAPPSRGKRAARGRLLPCGTRSLSRAKDALPFPCGSSWSFRGGWRRRASPRPRGCRP